MRYQRLFMSLIGSLLVLAFAGCSDTPTHPSDSLSRVEAALSIGTDGEGICTTLYAGQHIDAGTVCVNIDANDDLVVIYSTTGGWELVEAHLWVGTSLAAMPQTKTGNPQIGLFPYHSGDIAGATSYTFVVDLDALGISQDDCPEVTPPLLYAAAHAALQKPKADGTFQTETGWGFGERIVRRGNWATYFAFQIDCSDGEPHEVECETAFARSATDATCFIDLGFGNWGWTNGPMGFGSYRFELWAAAGQCDLTKGYLVGLVDVDYDESGLGIEVNAAPGFGLDAAHYYAGAEILPRFTAGPHNDFTVAPGQYPVVNELDYATVTTDSASFSDLSGDVHVVVHAVVCGAYSALD